MADDKQSGPGLGGNSIILLVAAAASAVYMGWRSPPLFSTRPTEPNHEISQASSTQDIDARLWQDPFTAVTRGIEDKRNTKVKPEDGHRIADFIKSLGYEGKAPETLLIGVDLPGDPYPEAVETRRRLRYAVLSALQWRNTFRSMKGISATFGPAGKRRVALRHPRKPSLPGSSKQPNRLAAIRRRLPPLVRPSSS